MTNLYHNKSLFNGKQFNKIKLLVNHTIEEKFKSALYHIDTPEEENRIKEMYSKILNELPYLTIKTTFNREQTEFIKELVKERWHIYSRSEKGKKDLNYMIQYDKIGWTLQETEFLNDSTKLKNFIEQCGDERIIREAFYTALTQNFTTSIDYLLSRKDLEPDFKIFDYIMTKTSSDVIELFVKHGYDIHIKNEFLLYFAIVNSREDIQKVIIEHSMTENRLLEMARQHKVKNIKNSFAYKYFKKTEFVNQLENSLTSNTNLEHKKMKI